MSARDTQKMQAAGRGLLEGGTLVSSVATQAAATPDAIAVICGDERLTYAGLTDRASLLARYLRTPGIGVRPGVVAAVHLERGLDLIVALLAVLQAGGAYALLDTGFPDSRLRWMLEASGASVLITDTEASGLAAGSGTALATFGGAEAAAGAPPAEVPDVQLSPDDGACVMFTSGSTGVPKGLMTTHAAVLGTFAGQSYLDFGPHQVYLQCSPVSWDAFALEVFGALIYGGTCVLPQGHRADPREMSELITRHNVTTLQLSASLFNVMVDDYLHVFAGLREVMTAGEAASCAHCAKLLRWLPYLRLVNGYGPAESMGFTTIFQITQAHLAQASVPIGRPLIGKMAYVLDERLRLVPAGVAGELSVAGIGLARGYLGRPGATAERFVPNPYGAPGSRMYRTGDVARWNGEEFLEFLGRSDEQIKLSGIRIEPAEVEASLTALPGVRRAAAVVREDRAGDRRLVGYILAEGRATLDTVALRRRLAETVPSHLVPSALVQLDAFPLTANGKLDRRALPPPPAAAKPGWRPAANMLEEQLRDLFADVLGLAADQISTDDDFFDLGGNSLLAIKLEAKARHVLGSEFVLRDLFRRPTVQELAALFTNRSS